MPSRIQNNNNEIEYLDLMNSSCFDNATSAYPIDNNSNNFENDVDMWQNWMRWDGAVDFPATDSPQTQHTSSSIWSTETPDIEQNLTRVTNMNAFPFGDCQFEPEESNEEMSFDSPDTQSRSGGQIPQNYPVLTDSEVQALQAIAMPFRMFTDEKSNDMTASINESTISSPPSPEPQSKTRKNKKRKSIIDDELPADLCQSRKRGHNAIEKRYRTNLNAKIDCLRQGVPGLCDLELKSGDEIEDDSDGEVNGKAAQQKHGKAAILTRALEYIKHLETTTTRFGDDIDSLRLRVAAFEKLAMSGSNLSNTEVYSSQVDAEINTETLESIQADFQQTRPRRKSPPLATPVTRKKSAKQAREA